MLFAYAVTLLGNAATAEEAVQESFRIACMKPEALIRSDNPVGWMVNTMKHAVRNIKRTQLRRRIGATLSLDDDEVCLAQPGRPDEYADVEFSDLMTDEEYRMLKWHVLLDVSIKDIAETMDISEEACKKRIQRTKKRVQKILSEKN
ncbi:MAG: RNA polymerase sigma factor [Oscillospiraceae bacterium]